MGEQHIVRARRRGIRRATALVVALVISVFAPTAPALAAAQPAGSVSGTVRASDGGSIGNALVRLEGRGETYTSTDEVAVNDTGSWTIEGVPDGEYTVGAITYTPNRQLTWYGASFIVRDGEAISGIDVVVTPRLPDDLPEISARGAYGPEVGARATLNLEDWGDVDVTYQWLLDGVPLVGATDSEWLLTPNEHERYIAVSVTVSHPRHPTVTLVSDRRWVGTGSFPRAKPSIRGTPVPGETVTVDPGVWPAGTKFSYAWSGGSRSGLDFPNTGSTFVIPESAVGTTIHARVTATLKGYRTTTVVAELPTPVHWLRFDTGTPTLKGDRKVGSVLTVDPGTWHPAPDFTYIWRVNGEVATEAGSALRIPSSALGGHIEVTVIAKKSGYLDEGVDVSALVRYHELTAPTPTIKGSVRVGETIEAVPGAWTKGTALGYTWLVGGKPDPGAYGKQWTVPESANGKVVSVQVSGSKQNYEYTVKTSKAVRVAPGVMWGETPRITGEMRHGGKVTVEHGVWAPTKTTFRYQWYAAGRAIPGATKKTLVIPKSAVGKTLSVKVTASAPAYSTTTRWSKRTLRILDATVPRLVGTAKVGRTLAVRIGTWTSGTNFSYRWFYENGREVRPLRGDRTLDLRSAQAGHRLRVKVSANKPGYETAVVWTGYSARIRR